MLPKLSIITVVRNDPQGLLRTLENLTSLDYPDKELVLIDGASTDSTMQVAERYADRLSYVMSEPDKGLYDAMNKGLRASTGDYVWFINAGDVVACSGGRLIEIFGEMASQGGWQSFPVVYGDTVVVDEQGAVLGLRGKPLPKQLGVNSFLRGMVVCHQSILVSRTIAPYYEDQRYRYSADIEWVLESLQRTRKARLGTYNAHCILSQFEAGGISTKHRKASLVERWKIMRRHYGLLRTAAAHVLFAVELLFRPTYRKLS